MQATLNLKSKTLPRNQTNWSRLSWQSPLSFAWSHFFPFALQQLEPPLPPYFLINISRHLCRAVINLCILPIIPRQGSDNRCSSETESHQIVRGGISGSRKGGTRSRWKLPRDDHWSFQTRFCDFHAASSNDHFEVRATPATESILSFYKYNVEIKREQFRACIPSSRFVNIYIWNDSKFV